MKHFRFTQQALGERIGVTKGYLSVMMNDKEPISTKVLDRLIKSFTGLNTHWLLTGEGEMFLVKKDVVLAQPEVGVLTGVMEPALQPYEKGKRGGVLEEALSRLSAMEDKLSEMNDKIAMMENEMERLAALVKKSNPPDIS